MITSSPPETSTMNRIDWTLLAILAVGVACYGSMFGAAVWWLRG